ncbi:MAG: hypothetical protein JWM80_1691 [Cyanobacteria bacterium RYN_339]|nr:hypothetical protein [Cyanobacteria bacterium RYN_339]
MTTILATIVVIHFLAVAAVLLMARHSVILVDEEGRPLKRAAWQERIVPSSDLPAVTPHR